MINRRIFLKDGGLLLLGMSTVPGFLHRAAMGGESQRRKTLITLFQRGGADGLNVVIPFAEKDYYRQRPSIAIPQPSSTQESALDLDGYFGLHPSLKPLLSLYQSRQLAIVHAVGSSASTRSHFDAQDYMESGVPGDKSVSDGWLNRYLQHQAAAAATSFRGVSMGTTLPRALQGEASALALGNLGGFDLQAGSAREQARNAYEVLYSQEANSLLSGTAQELFDAIDFLKKAAPERYQPASGVQYPAGRFGQSMKQLAQLIKADVGVEIAFVDIGGWDHHVNEGGVNGQLANQLRQFGAGLSAFHRDLADRMEDIVVVTLSEFGRTVRENGNAGTDHGHANVMFVLGGRVKGGKVYGKWPGLAAEQLFEGRDLALTTDFRDVFAELLSSHLGCRNLAPVFPGFSIDRQRFRGLL